MSGESVGAVVLRRGDYFGKVECSQMPEPGTFIPFGMPSDVVYHAYLPVLMRLRKPSPYYITGDYLSSKTPRKMSHQAAITSDVKIRINK